MGILENIDLYLDFKIDEAISGVGNVKNILVKEIKNFDSRSNSNGRFGDLGEFLKGNLDKCVKGVQNVMNSFNRVNRDIAVEISDVNIGELKGSFVKNPTFVVSLRMKSKESLKAALDEFNRKSVSDDWEDSAFSVEVNWDVISILSSSSKSDDTEFYIEVIIKKN